MSFKNIETNSNHVEINNMAKNLKDKANRSVVEIFSAVVNGKDLTKYGKNVDKVIEQIRTLGENAVNGDTKARAELNAIREIMIEAPLVKRLSVLDFMGEKITAGYNEDVRFKVYQLQGKKSDIQANSGSFAFPTASWREQVMTTKAISGGIVRDYREEATMNTDAMAVANEQVITDIMNQMFYEVMLAYYNGIKNATSLKNFAEAAGVNKGTLDAVIKKARRFGNVTIAGDYSVISQMESFASFSVANATVAYSEAVMEEIRKSGMLKFYKGFPVVEIPNTYNLTKLNGNADFYETYLPEGLLLVLPAGANSPLKIGLKGGLTSMSATDINLRAEITRYDMEFGTELIKELVPNVGLISDSNYDVDKR